MRLVVDLGEVLKIEMGVDLRGTDIRMPQQLLHRTQVTARLQHVAGKGVPQGMRVQVTRDALPPGDGLPDPMQRP